MRSLRWTEQNSVHVPEIDAEHQEMFRLAAELRHALLDGGDPRRVDLLGRHLTTEIAGHLAHEERLMRGAAYPSLQWHERQHQTGRARLATLDRALRNGAPDAIFESLERFAGWLHDHTSVADRMVGAYLRNYRRTHSGAPQ